MEKPVADTQEAGVVADEHFESGDENKMEVEMNSMGNEIVAAVDHSSSSSPLEIQIRVSFKTPVKVFDIEMQTPKKKDEAPKTVELGKTFLPFTVQVCLSVLTIFLGTGSLSSSAEAKKLLHVAAACNMLGYIGCLADILIGQTKSKVARIAGKIGATASVFGFSTTMSILFAQNFWMSVAVAALVSLSFLIALMKV